MTEGSTQGLLWAYVALVFLTALAVVVSRWPRPYKWLLVAATAGLYVFGARQLDEVWGWPGRSALPARFVLLASVAEEPTPKSSGALYVWVNAIEQGRSVREPRAFRLPYSKDLHGLLDEAMKKQRQGVSQMGTTEPARGRQGYSWLRPGSDEQQIKIRDLPTPQLPEK